jgi:2-pyrone-4,6-dicarboxylate lactonase
VVDHMGRPDVTKSVDGREFAQFLRLMDEHENIWCKVTCPERISVTGPPTFDDVVPFAKRVIAQFPDRVLWGTDWPHPNLHGFMPDDGKSVDYIPRIAENEELQRKLLVANPMRLYWGDDV